MTRDTLCALSLPKVDGREFNPGNGRIVQRRADYFERNAGAVVRPRVELSIVIFAIRTRPKFPRLRILPRNLSRSVPLGCPSSLVRGNPFFP